MNSFLSVLKTYYEKVKANKNNELPRLSPLNLPRNQLKFALKYLDPKNLIAKEFISHVFKVQSCQVALSITNGIISIGI